MPWMTVTGASFLFPRPGQFLRLLLFQCFSLSEGEQEKDD